VIHTVVRFGSCLSPSTRRPDSIPDLLALVDDLDATLRALQQPRVVRGLARVLPPLTLAADGAKLNLIEPSVALAELRARRDLYLAGRLSKRLEIVLARDRTIDALVDEAVRAVVESAALGLPRRISLDDAVLRCLQISYLAEVRPEGADKARALHDAFPDFYRARFRPLVEAHARARGLAITRDAVVDDRPPAVRIAEARALRSLLLRSRTRAVLRWPKQALVYRGWLPYVIGKWRRAVTG
jgi:hypothetical protein